MKKLLIECDACDHTETKNENSGLYGWHEVRVNAHRSHHDFIVCDKCWQKMPERFRQTLWQKFVEMMRGY